MVISNNLQITKLPNKGSLSFKGIELIDTFEGKKRSKQTKGEMNDEIYHIRHIVVGKDTI